MYRHVSCTIKASGVQPRVLGGQRVSPQSCHCPMTRDDTRWLNRASPPFVLYCTRLLRCRGLYQIQKIQMAAAGWTRLVIVADDIITVIVQPMFDSKKPTHALPGI